MTSDERAPAPSAVHRRSSGPHPRAVPARVHDLVLPWARPPISANDRMGWHARARLTSEVRIATGWLARAARIGRSERIRVQLIWTPAERRRRDSDNPGPTVKAAVDGLVDAGVVPDDTDDYVERAPTVIAAADPGAAGLVLRVERLAAAHPSSCQETPA